MVRYITEDYGKTDDKSKIESDGFTVVVAILLYLSFGILLTIGSFLWVRSEMRAFFDLSYAGYGMLLIVIISVSELWALFIQIPSIKGYDEIVAHCTVARWFDVFRKFAGTILLMLVILSVCFFVGPKKEVFHLYLAKVMYCLSDYSQNNYVERLAILDEVIDREGANAEQFAERGKIYLEIAMIKDDGTEEYKYSLPGDTAEECYKIAINNFDDAIAQDDEVAEYYYLRGKAEYHDRISKYSVARDDLQKAIELDDTVPDYYFYCGKAWYGISTDNDEAIQNALNYIDIAIEKYTKAERESIEDLEEGSESGVEVDTDIESVDKLDSVKDKAIAEYYYYAGLINTSINSDESLERAIKNYRNAVVYDSKNAEYFSQLGIVYYGRDTSDDLTKAESAFDRAISIDKDNSDYYNEGYHLAWKAHVIERDETRIGKAIEVYEESLRFRADYSYSYKRLAELYKTKNDDVAVKNVYSRAIKNCTDNAEFYYACGCMHYDEKDFEHTIEDMKKAMEGNSSYTADACYYIGCSYHQLKVYNKAYEYYQLAKDNGSDRSDIDKDMNNCLEYMEY